MTTKLLVFNLARRHLAIGRAISATSEATEPARALEEFYDQVVGEVLRDFNWPFARTFAALEVIDGVASRASLDFQYSYAYPSDCVFAREVLVQSRRPQSRETRIPFVIGVGDVPAEAEEDPPTTALVIFTDAAPVDATDTTVALPQLEYSITPSEALWPADFTQAVALLLAFYVAPSQAGGDPAKLGQRAYALYDRAMSIARAAAQNEQEPDPDPDSDMITVRS